MKTRFRLYQRGGCKAKDQRGFFYSYDNDTHAQKSLGTRDKKEALRIIAALNEAHQQPAINLQIARGYLLASDSRYNERTWGYVLECVTKQKQGSTKLRWLNVAKDKALASLWPKSLMQTKADDLLEALNLGTVSTNVYLRRLHNFAVDMAWIPCPIIVKRQWPSVSYGAHRAITAAEHKMILQREGNAERKSFYELCWHLGGSQGDVASLRAEDIDWKHRSVSYHRKKTGTPARLRFGVQAEAILRELPKQGPLFPNLSTVRSSDRATEFKQRCEALGIKGITLHSYRYSWAERARQMGYPERFAQAALGHSSKAVARAYARNADMSLPSLEEFENGKPENLIPLPISENVSAEGEARIALATN